MVIIKRRQAKLGTSKPDCRCLDKSLIHLVTYKRKRLEKAFSWHSANTLLDEHSKKAEFPAFCLIELCPTHRLQTTLSALRPPPLCLPNRFTALHCCSPQRSRFADLSYPKYSVIKTRKNPPQR